MSEIPVTYNKQVGPSHYLLGLKAESLSKGSPGQFLQIRVRGKETTDPLLRRPFSVYDVDQQQQIVSIVYRVVGRGTRILSEVKTGNKLGILGPLGSGFTLDFYDKQLLIIGGGMGIAPLYYLARQLTADNHVRVLLGGDRRNQLEFFIQEFRGLDCR
ncbi:MAG: dihydroorotate dehydrogenase electron transfer subunit, partial [Bacillota bacterium]